MFAETNRGRSVGLDSEGVTGDFVEVDVSVETDMLPEGVWERRLTKGTFEVFESLLDGLIVDSNLVSDVFMCWSKERRVDEVCAIPCKLLSPFGRSKRLLFVSIISSALTSIPPSCNLSSSVLFFFILNLSRLPATPERSPLHSAVSFSRSAESICSI